MNLIDSILFSDRTPKVLKKALDFNAQKTAITASNISNADTPGYKSMSVEFENVLQQATGEKSIPMTGTNPRHIRPDNPDIKSLKANMVVDQSQGRLDGNNVNLEKEMTNLAEAQINYNAVIQAYTKRGETIKSAITESR